jgi:hypothetical protein
MCKKRFFGGDGNTIIIVLLLLLIEHRIRALFSQKKKTRARNTYCCYASLRTLFQKLSFRGGAKTLISVSLLHFFCFGDDDLRTRRCCCLKFSFFSNPKIIWLFQAHAFLKNRHTTKKKDAADTKKTVDEESHINLFDKRSRDEYYPSK